MDPRFYRESPETEDTEPDQQDSDSHKESSVELIEEKSKHVSSSEHIKEKPKHASPLKTREQAV
jgi:hypothetical protein